MVFWRKLVGFLSLIFFTLNCLPESTCVDELKDNSELEFNDFIVKEFYKENRNHFYLENTNGDKIFIIEEFGILISDKIQRNDTLSKKKNENIIYVKRKNVDIKYSLICKDDNSVLLVDTLKVN